MDKRLQTNRCAHCGRGLEAFKDAEAEASAMLSLSNKLTKDHVPSRIFLDNPYPNNLPTVPSCYACNNAFAIDEEYVACLIECLIAGTTIPQFLKRTKVVEILRRSSLLRNDLDEIVKAHLSGNYTIEHDDRVKTILMKSAVGHVGYEEFPRYRKPSHCSIFVLDTLEPVKRARFENPVDKGMPLLPEIGSRLFSKVLKNSLENTWNIVQPDNYRYAVTTTSKTTSIRIVIREFLGAKLSWLEPDE
jgi:hypothetical protein